MLLQWCYPIVRVVLSCYQSGSKVSAHRTIKIPTTLAILDFDDVLCTVQLVCFVIFSRMHCLISKVIFISWELLMASHLRKVNGKRRLPDTIHKTYTTHLCIHTYTHGHTHTHIHTHSYRWIHIHMQTHIHTQTHTNTYTRVHTHTHTHTNTHTHKHTHTNTNTNTHIHICWYLALDIELPL
jgi:hypothetical protein